MCRPRTRFPALTSIVVRAQSHHPPTCARRIFARPQRSMIFSFAPNILRLHQPRKLTVYCCQTFYVLLLQIVSISSSKYSSLFPDMWGQSWRGCKSKMYCCFFFTFMLSADVRNNQVPVPASEHHRGKPGPDRRASGVLLARRDIGRPQGWRQVIVRGYEHD